MSLEDLLKEFAKIAYWYGEDTGDYDMVSLLLLKEAKNIRDQLELIDDKHCT